MKGNPPPVSISCIEVIKIEPSILCSTGWREQLFVMLEPKPAAQRGFFISPDKTQPHLRGEARGRCPRGVVQNSDPSVHIM